MLQGPVSGPCELWGGSPTQVLVGRVLRSYRYGTCLEARLRRNYLE